MDAPVWYRLSRGVTKRVYCRKHEFQDTYHCTLPRSQGISSPAGFLPRLTQVTLTIFPNITCCLLLGTAWCQLSSAPVTIREHVSSASTVHKCESQEVIGAILLVALSLSNVLSGENFSIVSEFKLRWAQWFFSLFLGRLEIKISNPTVKITNLL